MKDVLELRKKRAQLVEQSRAILDKAEKEKRDLTAEEQQEWNRIMGQVDTIKREVDTEERQQTLDRELLESQRNPNRPDPSGNQNRQKPRATDEYRAAFANYLIGGAQNLSSENVRALQADQGSLGGYIVIPEQMMTTLIQGLDDAVFIRPLATVTRLEKAESMGAPSLDADPADADWTSEIATGDEDSTMQFGKRELSPHPLAKLLKVSETLIRRGALPVEQIVTGRLSYKFGISEEKAFLSGSGANQPLGVFTASNDGISTARDFSTGNTTTSIQFDGLMEAKYGLKSGYWRRAQWVFHRDAIKQIAKLKDGDGQYIWQPDVKVGQPDRLLNFPLNVSENAPNTFTTGLYVGILADFSFYWIVDALDIMIKRLVELYARTNQIGFIGRKETDGMPVLEEAFARVTLA